VGGEGSRSSGLVNGSLVTGYKVLACKWADNPTSDCPAVFEELLIVFNCSVLSF
jgi:hypothetical protein